MTTTANRRSFALPRAARLGLISTTTVLAVGCASVPHPNPNDPWEGMNRGIQTFNDNVDGALIKPIAEGYTALTPKPVRTCVSNIFNNMADAWSAVNSFLQGEHIDFFNTLGRVLFNSTMGLGGCIDVASMNGSRRIENDFGVTLGVWGIKPGPYIVVPFLGPSTVRDAAARGTSFFEGFSSTGPIMAIRDVPVRNSLMGLWAVDARAGLLDAEKLVNDIALDRYSFIRDAYLQRRNSMVQSRRAGDSAEQTLPDYSDADE
ncbi:MAG TPA: VacJ family lipoprotein [Alcaligenes sp.]|nr:VacJ family lipoprotein [Alcaligenes sp.]HRL26069.1 VacJ family lipoprotein [Alcaligenes sp.]